MPRPEEGDTMRNRKKRNAGWIIGAVVAAVIIALIYSFAVHSP